MAVAAGTNQAFKAAEPAIHALHMGLLTALLLLLLLVSYGSMIM
jgi:hypothetical protein